MNRASLSGVARPLSITLLFLGGITTRCGCGDDIQPADMPTDAVSNPDPIGQVPGCADPLRDRAPTSVNTEECDGSDSAGNPTVFQPGQELQVRPAILHKCTDQASYTVAQSFQLYWTICNVSDNNASTLLPYQLVIDLVHNGTIAPFRTLDFTQPNLARCACQTVSVVFNSSDPDPTKKLSAGVYQFRLTNGPNYDGVAIEQATVTP
jgi:hypothetical protein